MSCFVFARTGQTLCSSDLMYKIFLCEACCMVLPFWSQIKNKVQMLRNERFFAYSVAIVIDLPFWIWLNVLSVLYSFCVIEKGHMALPWLPVVQGECLSSCVWGKCGLSVTWSSREQNGLDTWIYVQKTPLLSTECNYFKVHPLLTQAFSCTHSVCPHTTNNTNNLQSKFTN